MPGADEDSFPASREMQPSGEKDRSSTDRGTFCSLNIQVLVLPNPIPYESMSRQLPNVPETVKRHAQPNPLSRAKNTNLLCYTTCNFQRTFGKQIITACCFLLLNQRCNWALEFQVITETIRVSNQFWNSCSTVGFFLGGGEVKGFWREVTGTAYFAILDHYFQLKS